MSAGEEIDFVQERPHRHHEAVSCTQARETSPASERSRAADAVRLGWLALLVAMLPMLADGFLPLTAAIERGIDASASFSVITIFFLGMLCGQLLVALLGRDERLRTWTRAALATMIVALGAMVVADAPHVLAGARFSQGAAVGVCIASVRALAYSLRRSGGGAAAALGWLNVAAAFVAAIAPLLNGILAEWWSWRAAAIAPALAAAIALAAWPIKPTHAPEAACDPLVTGRVVVGLAFCACTFFALYAWLGALTQALLGAGGEMALAGAGQAASTAGFVGGAIGVATKRIAFGRRTCAIAAAAAALGAGAAWAITEAVGPTWSILVAPLVMAGIGVLLTFSVAFTISGSPGRTMGVAALAGCSQAGGGAGAGMALAMAPGNAAPAAAALLACAVVVLATKAADWR